MEADRYPRLSPAEECDLARRYQHGDEHAGHWLVCCNLCLAMSVMSKYSTNALVEKLDLIQQANIGLIRAAKKYNPESGNRFSTYAVPWILAEVSRYRDEQSHAVRIPQHAALAHRRQIRGEALASEARTLDAALPWLTDACYSLDIPLQGRESDSGSYADIVEDPRAEAAFSQALDRSEVAVLLDCLPARRRQVLELLYGFAEVEQQHTPATLAQRFGVSRRRIQQIEVQALQQLRKIVAEGAVV